MPARLETIAASGGGPGRAIPVPDSKPLMFRSRTGSPVARLSRDGTSWRLQALNGAPVSVNGGSISDTNLVSGDEILIGRDRFRILDDGPEVVEPFAARAPVPVDPAARSSRRMSMSRTSSVNATSQSGVLDRVVAAFNGKDRARLASLEQERRRLLHDAGLSSLQGAGIGLAQPILARLLRGESIRVRLDDLIPGAVDAWRARRRRLGELDTAIHSVRRALGLPPDQESLIGPSPRSSGSGSDPINIMADATTQPIDPT